MCQRQRAPFLLLLLTLLIPLALAARPQPPDPAEPPESLESQAPLRPFFGLLHSHTSFSDGSGMPAEAYASAREAGLDFFAVTEHSHEQASGEDGIFLTEFLYDQLKKAAQEATEDGAFVALYGQEWSTISRGNHVNLFNASEICRVENGDFRELYEVWLPDHPEVPFIQLNHPNFEQDLEDRGRRGRNDYGLDDYDDSFPALAQALRGRAALIEMIIGPAFGTATNKPHRDSFDEDDYLFYLNQGFQVGPSVGQDNHLPNWGFSHHARLGVWAQSLTPDGIYAALAARRTYASEDENVHLAFTVNGTWMGSELELETGEAADVRVSIQDPDEPEAEYTAALFYDDAGGGDVARIIQSADSIGGGELRFTHVPATESDDERLPQGYYFVRIRQQSGAEVDADEAWTAPVWIAGIEDTDGDEDDDGDADHGDEMDIDWRDAEDFVGRERVVTGRIVSTFNSGRALFLNFDPDFSNTLTLVVLDEHFEAVGGADNLENKVAGNVVRVRGEISTFRGRLQILISSADQILEVSD